MLGMNRRARYKRFHYEPRHFDPQKDELENRLEMKRFEEGKDVDPSRYRERISRVYQENKRVQKSDLNRMLRLAGIAAILLVILFVYDIPTKLINLFVR